MGAVSVFTNRNLSTANLTVRCCFVLLFMLLIFSLLMCFLKSEVTSVPYIDLSRKRFAEIQVLTLYTIIVFQP